MWVNDQTYSSWQTQTKSVINDFFGFTSAEYNFIFSFSFIRTYSENVNNQINRSKVTMNDFLQRCIVTIERKKLFRPPEPVIQYVEKPVTKEVIREVIKEVQIKPKKVNIFLAFFGWLKRRDVLALITTTLAVLAIPFWIGWYFGEKKNDVRNYDLRNENNRLNADKSIIQRQNKILYDSLRIYFPLQIPNTKSDNNAKGNQKNENPNTTHK